jgi:hypothetical protein
MGRQPLASGTLVELAITVRLAVASYSHETLDELFKRYPGETGIYSLREMIENTIATQLKKGWATGGNIIKAWDPKTRHFEQLAEEEL